MEGRQNLLACQTEIFDCLCGLTFADFSNHDYVRVLP